MAVMTIDIHTHILPPDIPKFKEKFGYGGFMTLHKPDSCCHADMIDDTGNFFRRIELNCLDPKLRIKDCDEHNIDKQVISTVPVMFSYWAKPNDGLYISQFLNDHIAVTVADHPHRFIGLGTLPLQDIELSVKEMQRCKNDLGLAGFQIGTNINGKNLNEPEFFPIYQACVDLDMCLFVHPWDMMGKDHLPKYFLPWLVSMPAETSRAICCFIFGGVFEKFPRLRVAFAHGGGSFPATLGRIKKGFEARPDLCAIDNPHAPHNYLGKFYLDTLVHDPFMLRHLVDLVGADHVALGSDYPFPLGETIPGSCILNGNFTEQEKEWMLSKSALSWLGVGF